MPRTLTLYGMIDPHTHLRGLNWSHKGTFASETAAALAGGYWAVFDMPNTPPATIDPTTLKTKIAEIQSQAVCDWGIYFGAADNTNWRFYNNAINGVCGLKIYNNETTGALLINDQQLREAHYAAWPAHKPIAVHAEDNTVNEILQLVRRYRKTTHFCHISTAQEIAQLIAAKNEGLPVTIGVCPHHLYFTQDDLNTLGSRGLMKPELKSKTDQAALWKAVSEGIVDVIESDHAPHTLEEKAQAKPPYGVPGLETTLPLMLSAVEDGRLTLDRLIPMLTLNPQHLFGLHCPPETYTVVDLEVSYTINRASLHTQCGWSPFEGMRVAGKVREVWIRGKKVFNGENILIPNGFGQNVFL